MNTKPNILLVLQRDWELVRHEFTQMEKDLLNNANVGEVICPRGICIDLDQVGNPGVKLKKLIEDLPNQKP